MHIFFDNEKVKIIQLSDIHISYPIQSNTLEAIEKIIYLEDPDLIIFSGDLFHRYHSEEDSIRLITEFNQFMLKCHTKYTFCFGNHDAELSLTKVQIFKLLMKNENFVGVIGEELYTRFHRNDSHYKDPRIGNFIINVYQKNKKTAQVLLLDSGRYNNEGKDGSLTEDQASIQGLDDNKLPLLIFFHIPLEQFDKYYLTNRIKGLKRERTCFQTEECGLFERLKNFERDVLINCGHDHLNDFELNIDNLWLNMTPGMCFEEYNEQSVRGYRVFNIEAGREVDTYIKNYII